MVLRKRKLHRAGALGDKKLAPEKARYSVSIGREAYRALERFCNKHKRPLSSVVEELIRNRCGATDTRQRRHPPGWHGVVNLEFGSSGRGNGRSDFLERGTGPISKPIERW